MCKSKATKRDAGSPADQCVTAQSQCVTAQSETMLALNDHSEQLTEAKTEIKSLKNENRKLTFRQRLDNMDAAFKAALERVENVERTATSNQHILKNSNIVLEGVTETPSGNCIDKVRAILKEFENK